MSRITLPNSGDHSDYGRELAGIMRELHAMSLRLNRLDPLTTELVRMRCAEWHNCRRCKDAIWEGAADHDRDSLVAVVQDYEASDLDERRKLALRLADAFMTRPHEIGVDLRRDLHETFSVEELVEIVLDIVAWTQHKPAIALDLDEVPTSLSRIFRIDEDGDIVRQAATLSTGE